MLMSIPVISLMPPRSRRVHPRERPVLSAVGGAVWIDPHPDVHDVNDMLPRDEVGGPLHIDHHDLGGR